MKNLTRILFLCLTAGQLMLIGCTSEAKQEPELIVNIVDIAGKALPEVEGLLGKSESQEKVTGYPCKNSDCTREYFQNGKFEVIFKEGKADRITINEVPDLSSTESAITALGLPDSKPTFANPEMVMRWENVQGIDEIAFFTSYVLVIVDKSE